MHINYVALWSRQIIRAQFCLNWSRNGEVYLKNRKNTRDRLPMSSANSNHSMISQSGLYRGQHAVIVLTLIIRLTILAPCQWGALTDSCIEPHSGVNKLSSKQNIGDPDVIWTRNLLIVKEQKLQKQIVKYQFEDGQGGVVTIWFRQDRSRNREVVTVLKKRKKLPACVFFSNYSKMALLITLAMLLYIGNHWLFIDRIAWRSREIMHLVASVHLSVCALTRQRAIRVITSLRCLYVCL